MVRNAGLIVNALLAALMLLAAPANGELGAMASEPSPLARELDKVGENLCKSLDLKCSKSKAAVGKKPRAAGETKTPVPSPNAKPRPIEAIAASDSKPISAIPIPRRKPARLAGQTRIVGPALQPPPPSAMPVPAVALPSAPARRPEVSAPENTISGGDCFAALRMSNVEFETVATPVSTGLCLVDAPVRLHAVPTTRGRVVLPDNPTLNCRFARQFTLWLSEAGAPVVYAQMNSSLAKLSTGPGFDCRGRNGDSSAKLSAHAFGNAVDIATITTADGRIVRVSDALVTTSPAFTLLRGLRMTACGYFSTVLGPGANAAHASHFHFDMELHGKSDNYRICQ